MQIMGEIHFLAGNHTDGVTQEDIAQNCDGLLDRSSQGM
jgi:hypothetical protein